MRTRSNLTIKERILHVLKEKQRAHSTRELQCAPFMNHVNVASIPGALLDLEKRGQVERRGNKPIRWALA